MTRAQEIKLNQVREAFKHLWLYQDTHEIKKEDVEENEFFVSIYLEEGLKGDEGTIAAIFCRNSCLIAIGKRGGLKDLRTGKEIKYVCQAKNN